MTGKPALLHDLFRLLFHVFDRIGPPDLFAPLHSHSVQEVACHRQNRVPPILPSAQRCWSPIDTRLGSSALRLLSWRRCSTRRTLVPHLEARRKFLRQDLSVIVESGDAVEGRMTRDRLW